MPSIAKPSSRLVELDSLRGLAAVVVMLFHYTTKFDELFGHTTPLAWHAPLGKFGVNLFFIISGFVIFMTLARTARAMDFFISRFSRLFPAFWAAVIVSFLLTHLLGVPGKTVSLETAALNLFMIHGMFGIPDVDGVYWTLEIELIFYGLAFLLFSTGQATRVHWALLALVALRLATHLASTLAGVHISWTLSHLLILPQIAWFACGIMIYRRITYTDQSPAKDWFVVALATFQLAVTDGLWVGVLCASLTAGIWAAATGRLRILQNAVLVWLGTISYTLYLLHENIGWGLILHLEKLGFRSELAISLAIVMILALASSVTWLVEKPAMAWIRTAYRTRTAVA
jgi:peptidoglycan/LPS O-acetylase OafA/YrhL